MCHAGDDGLSVNECLGTACDLLVYDGLIVNKGLGAVCCMLGNDGLSVNNRLVLHVARWEMMD